MSGTNVADSSAFSSEKVLDRLSTARGQASKEANRLFVGSLILAGLFLIKASGLRVDLTLFETDIGKVPYGLFFFLVSSQLSMVLSYMRSADSAAINSRLRDAIAGYGIEDVAASERTFVNEFEWFAASESEFTRKASGSLSKVFFGLTGLLTSLTAMALYTFPSAAGIYTLLHYQTMISGGEIDVQYWVLFGSTVLSILWFINFIAIWAVVRR